MGIKEKLSLVIYTHTDYNDVWKITFRQLQKYMNDFKIYVLCNERSMDIPQNWETITYDESKIYTQRLKDCLPFIDSETIMFMHEDMPLFDKPNFEYMERYFDLVNSEKVDSIKMIYVRDDNEMVSDVDNTLISSQYSKFSIQPTLINVKNFVSLLDSTQPLNIWDFELAVSTKGKHFMCKIGGEKKRGVYHYDSLVFPYIATAIIKGKWNYGEYPKELDELFNEYGIIPFERGIA